MVPLEPFYLPCRLNIPPPGSWELFATCCGVLREPRSLINLPGAQTLLALREGGGLGAQGWMPRCQEGGWF